MLSRVRVVHRLSSRFGSNLHAQLKGYPPIGVSSFSTFSKLKMSAVEDKFVKGGVVPDVLSKAPSQPAKVVVIVASQPASQLALAVMSAGGVSSRRSGLWHCHDTHTSKLAGDSLH